MYKIDHGISGISKTEKSTVGSSLAVRQRCDNFCFFSDSQPILQSRYVKLLLHPGNAVEQIIFISTKIRNQVPTR